MTRSASGTSSHRCVAHSTATERSRAHGQQQLEQVAAARRIEPDRRLVHQQHARLVQQRARELDPPAVAAAQLRGLVMGALGRARAAPARSSMRACATARGMPCRPAWNRRLAVTDSSRSSVGCWNTMPSRGQRRHRIARHVVAHHLDAAGIGDEQPGQELEQRRLAGAVGPEQRDELAGDAPCRLTPSTARIGP